MTKIYFHEEGFPLVRLLIVDDEKMICEEFRETLEHEGYQVDCALNGKEGLKKIQHHRYHLVFLDASMPLMDGQRVFERIRHFSKVPVAFISGFLSGSREKEILDQGALACLQKPLDLGQVKALIRVVENNVCVH